MAMFSPAYRLSIGKSVVDTTDKPQASRAVELVVNLDLDVPADRLLLVLGNADGPQPARGDQATIELGYADDGALTQVIVGEVVALERGLVTTRVVGYSGADAILRTFVDQTYEAKTAGEIVKDLAGQAGITVAVADDGITFPAYVVDGRRSAYAHMQDLAALCGFDLYLNSDGELVFESFTGGKAVHTLEYAKQVLAVDALRTPPAAGLVEAWGESPTGSQGADAWPWLTPDFSSSKGSAGSGVRLLLQNPALRTAAAAAAAAQAALTTIERRSVRGQLTIPGQPEIKLGDAIALKSMPDPALNDTFQVRSVTHRVSKRWGFTSVVGFRAIKVTP